MSEEYLYKKARLKNTYNKAEKNKNYPFNFLKFSEPRSDYLIKGGATIVVQSWNSKRQKVLHSGLIPFSLNYYYGNNINKKGRKDFIIVHFEEKGKIVRLWKLNDKNPKNKKKFASAFISK